MIGTMMAMMHICVSVRADQVTVHRRFTGTPIDSPTYMKH